MGNILVRIHCTHFLGFIRSHHQWHIYKNIYNPSYWKFIPFYSPSSFSFFLPSSVYERGKSQKFHWKNLTPLKTLLLPSKSKSFFSSFLSLQNTSMMAQIRMYTYTLTQKFEPLYTPKLILHVFMNQSNLFLRVDANTFSSLQRLDWTFFHSLKHVHPVKRKRKKNFPLTFKVEKVFFFLYFNSLFTGNHSTFFLLSVE